MIPDCKILGLESLNQRDYDPSGVEKAISLYEGKPVFFDHSELGVQRKFIERFGRFKDVYYRPDQGLFGNFHFNPKHLYAETFRGWVETDPNGVGFSHFAEGEVEDGEDGRLKVKAITDVISIDLVARPASTKGLFESVTYMDPSQISILPPASAPQSANGTPPGATSATPDADSMELQIGKLVLAIINNAEFNADQKREKVLGALNLLADPVEPDVKPNEKPNFDTGDKPVDGDKPSDGDKPTPDEPTDNKDTNPVKSDELKKAEEAFLATLTQFTNVVTEAIKTVESKHNTSNKSPVSIPASAGTPTLTVEDLMTGFGS